MTVVDVLASTMTPPTDDVMTPLPLDLVIHADRGSSADQFSDATRAVDSISPLSTSPDSSPAGASDTGIDTGSDVSSYCGDATCPLQFVVMPTASRLVYDRLQLDGHPDVKPEPDAAYRPAYELAQQVRETSRTMTQPFQTSASAAAQSNFQCGVTVGYTYEAFIATDGRSRRRKSAAASVPQQGRTDGDAPTTTTTVVRRLGGRYTCSECGRHYATSSNLSRHKQTHRSLDSRYARACPHCYKPYVSMPALAMHILTHDLKLVYHHHRHCQPFQQHIVRYQSSTDH